MTTEVGMHRLHCTDGTGSRRRSGPAPRGSPAGASPATLLSFGTVIVSAVALVLDFAMG
jgi:hypothetical protein